MSAPLAAAGGAIDRMLPSALAGIISIGEVLHRELPVECHLDGRRGGLGDILAKKANAAYGVLDALFADGAPLT